MSTLKEAAEEFLSHKRIAVAGISRKGDTAGNIIYKKLRDTGYEVFAVNPNADEVEGDKCYPNLKSIDGGVEAVVIATHPKVTENVVRECADLGIRRVWMHRAFGQGSIDDKAIELCHSLGISVIPGSCPMMFCEPVDTGHKCIRWFLKVSGKEAKMGDYVVA